MAGFEKGPAIFIALSDCGTSLRPAAARASAAPKVASVAHFFTANAHRSIQPKVPTQVAIAGVFQIR